LAMLKLTLMNHTFQVPCKESDKAQLIEAATMLQDKLEQVQTLKGENKALMVALNICFDYIQLKQDTTQYTLRLDEQIDGVMTQITQETRS
jgi:cell division protein ZapA